MLNFALLTVEDETPADIYRQIHSELSEWLCVKKGIAHLRSPDREDHCWVTNLKDWRRVIGELAAENDLVFCTVDLRIPEGPDGDEPEARHGLAIINEITARQQETIRCCALTGLASSELQQLPGRSVPDVLFDFKGDVEHGYRNIVNYLKSQVLALIKSIGFVDSEERLRRVRLDEPSGKLHDHYLSKAAYYADVPTWHVPTLVIGAPGLGRRTLVEFVAYLADADLHVVDLGTASRSDNRRNFRVLQDAQRRIDQGRDADGGRRVLYYIANLDRYEPGVHSDESENCLWVLRNCLETIRSLGSTQPKGFPVGIAFGVSGEARLRILSPQTRSFIPFLEQCIAETTDFPLQHLGLDQNGWTTDHPRIVSLPSVKQCGIGFVSRVISDRLETLRKTLADRVPGYREQSLTLDDDVRDFLGQKTNWSQHGNFGGLVRALDLAFDRFVDDRAESQFQITRAHLDEQTRERLLRTVLNVDDVRLEFATTEGRNLVVVEYADFHVEDGELLVILGPSGCGKSTILRMLAGLLFPTSGTVSYRGTAVSGPSEKIGFIFQDYSLFPWLTVRQNIEFGPKMRGLEPAGVWSRIEGLLEVAKLAGFENAYASELSGGMRQRVAIVRALANDPDVLLMDEPFGALDVQTRWQMQDFLIETKELTGKTIVFVTHDIDEAVFVGDRIYAATPRPLRLAAEFTVPFSADARNLRLRNDPLFVTLVNKVRGVLLAEATAAERSDHGMGNRE
ncbi:ABC transporter ATP-binding protein [Planctomycetota bacterium]